MNQTNTTPSWKQHFTPTPTRPRLQRTKLGLTQTPNKSQSKWTLSQDNNYDHYHDHFTILTNWQAYMQHVVTDGRNDIGFIIQKSLCQKLLTSNEWCWGSGGGRRGNLWRVHSRNTNELMSMTYSQDKLHETMKFWQKTKEFKYLYCTVSLWLFSCSLNKHNLFRCNLKRCSKPLCHQRFLP